MENWGSSRLTVISQLRRLVCKTSFQFFFPPERTESIRGRADFYISYLWIVQINRNLSSVSTISSKLLVKLAKIPFPARKNIHQSKLIMSGLHLKQRSRILLAWRHCSGKY